jgi:hypothetical protein
MCVFSTRWLPVGFVYVPGSHSTPAPPTKTLEMRSTTGFETPSLHNSNHTSKSTCAHYSGAYTRTQEGTLQALTCAQACVRASARTHARTHTCAQTNTHTATFAYTHARTRTHARTHTHAHTLTHTHRYAVAALEYLDPKAPNAVQLLGSRLVVWLDKDGQWRCFEDLCPHRCAEF